MTAALTGFMASGKTTFGRAAAGALGLRFIDLDRELVAHHGTAAEIFARGGEALFRKIESQVLREVVPDAAGTVLSLGGGTILSPDNREWLHANARIIWLDTSFEIIMSEIGNSDRPVVRDRSADQIYSLYLERRKIYRATADVAVIIDSFDFSAATADLTEAVRTVLSL